MGEGTQMFSEMEATWAQAPEVKIVEHTWGPGNFWLSGGLVCIKTRSLARARS